MANKSVGRTLSNSWLPKLSSSSGSSPSPALQQHLLQSRAAAPLSMMLDQGTQVMLGCASTTTSLEEVSEQQRPSPRRAHACGLAAAQARQKDREQILEAGVRLALGRGQPPQL
eukprot:CAMPEP_0204088606 /NCGR_PEP_ID=MMETSP0360-20130528/186478_1 /ASSEMBLY_ACC=CAM_ASM_000342 /TAXON_ID=268821 /ORGANISM="Scrippsiella Hangoei, Strain SHTV-5" /LENGTH=113 /DNA_ID=CAMNT_0051037797 /DNA_START=54 /DNA_END=393 /DNA_ORIENTATION=-